jgi:3-oxoacyl-[acyl-carrier protein] reductase
MNRLRSIITGAAGGIGEAVVARLRDRGDAVIGIDRHSAPGIIGADLANDDDRARAISDAIAELGGVDVLVSVAGVFAAGSIQTTSLEAMRPIWAINLEAPIDLIRRCAPTMISQGFGRIVTITSVHARLAQPGCLAYDVSKAGLEAATRSAALDLAPHGILVNAVAPGFVRTAMSTLPDGTDETESPEFAAVYLSGRKLPIGRGATPEEIAPAVELLAGHENTYITGQVLTVDGGLTMTF